MTRDMRCLVGWHKWVKRVNDSGQAYLVCRRCQKQDDNEGAAAPLGWN
jgi:hypothetical protein